MKRPNGSGSIIKLSGNRRRPYAVVVTDGWDGETGKRKRRYIGFFERHRDAEDALVAYRLNPVPAPNVTFEQVYREWRATKRDASRASLNGYDTAWVTLSRLRNAKMKDIRAAQLQQVIDQAKRKDGAPYSRATLNLIKAVAVMIWDYATKNDIVEKNYAKFVTLPRAQKKEKERFTALEVKKIRDAAGVVPWADAILMMIYSGFRVSEFLSLDRFTVDLKERTFRAGVKSDAGRDRIVPIHPVILPHVKARLDKGGERMICDSRGAFSYARFLPVYYKALEEIGVRRLSPHATRHTFASMLAEARVPPVEIQRLLGHASYSMTADTYTHLDLSTLRDAVNDL